jgi:DNA-directed RNA polymerase specialized sigma24 family protein
MNYSINANRELRGAGTHSVRAYASPADFCIIFDQDMGSLYSLALLLTGSDETAQQCFLDALVDCRTGSTVFPEWARSWSRRAVIKSAIRLFEPAFRNLTAVVSGKTRAIASSVHPDARVVLELDLFERFVFVITVLEDYPTRECAALLGRSPHEVQQAQVQAFQAIAAGNRDALSPLYAEGAAILRESMTAVH